MPSRLSLISKRLRHEDLASSHSTRSKAFLLICQPNPQILNCERNSSSLAALPSSRHGIIVTNFDICTTYKPPPPSSQIANRNGSNRTHLFEEAPKNTISKAWTQGCRSSSIRGWSKRSFSYGLKLETGLCSPIRCNIGLSANKFARLYSSDDRSKDVTADTAFQTSEILKNANFQLAFARRRLREGDLSTAMEFIERSAAISRDVTDSAYFQITCCKALLNVGSGNDDGDGDGLYNSSADIMEKLQEMGVQPGIAIYNTLIVRAADARDADMAWEIYNLIRANGLKPNHITYAILQKLCRVTRDKQAYEQLYTHMENDPADRITSLNATEEVYCSHVFQFRWRYESLLPVYLRYFDPGPLRILGMLPSGLLSRPDDLEFSPPFYPNRFVLHIMIMAFLRKYNNLVWVRYLYNKFQEALRAGEPSILPLTWSHATYESFLKGLLRHPQEFGVWKPHNPKYPPPPELNWRNVLEAMANTPRQVINEKTGELSPALEPTVKTWTIIVQGYARNGKVAEVDAILESMEEYGPQPNNVTFNALIYRYSQRGYPQEAAKWLRRMRAKGFLANENTARALARLQDKKLVADTVGWATASAYNESAKDSAGERQELEDDYELPELDKPENVSFEDFAQPSGSLD